MLAATLRAGVAIFSHLFLDFDRWQVDGLDDFFTVATPKSEFSSIFLKGGFSFFSKSWDIDEVLVAYRHFFKKLFKIFFGDNVNIIRRGLVFCVNHADFFEGFPLGSADIFLVFYLRKIVDEKCFLVISF